MGVFVSCLLASLISSSLIFATTNYRIEKGLFDHRVGAAQDGRRDRQTERIDSLEIDDKLVLGRRLYFDGL